jgi:subtilase family serine protease
MILSFLRNTPKISLEARKRLAGRRIAHAAQMVALDFLEERRLLSAPHHYHTWHHLRSLPETAQIGVVVDSKVKAYAKGSGSRTGTVVPTYSGSSSPTDFTIGVWYSPAQIRHAYGVDQTSFGSIPADGSGQTIAIVDAYDSPTVQSDLQQFDKYFGLPDPPSFQVLYGSGSKPTADPSGSQGAGDLTWETETALDVEWSHVMAPEANIVLVEANSDEYADLIGPSAANGDTPGNYGGVYTATHTPSVSVVSMSWGGGEFGGETNYDAYFSSLSGHTGITFFASTGDSGNPGGYPSWSPDVVAVGGTSLYLSSGNYSSESAWSSSGGGISRFETPQPSYQSGVVTQSTTKRTTPDVSIVANPSTGVPVYDSYDFGSSDPWIQLGGTSLSSPLWAGIMAMVNQDRALNGMSPLDGPTQTLPDLYNLPSSDFHDITTGANNKYSATTGYDLVTGIGTPIAQNLIPDLAGVSASTGISFSAGPYSTTNNTVTLVRDADGVHDDISLNGSPVQQFIPADATTINFIGGAGTGNDTFTINFSKGNPLAAGNTTESANGVVVPSITITGGDGVNALDVIGTASNDNVTASNSGITFGGGIATTVAPSISNIQTVALIGGSGGNDSLNVTSGNWNIDANTASGTPNVAVNVSGGALATFIGNESLAGLMINAATVALPSLSTYTITLQGALSITGGGTLDLQEGEMLLDTTDTSYTTLQNYLAAGYKGGAWNGSGGIKSSAAAANLNQSTALGSGNGADGVVAGLQPGEEEVKYTFYGDADLNGTVDINDLNTVLSNYLPGKSTTWDTGDFNFDGKTDISDLNNLFSHYLA